MAIEAKRQWQEAGKRTDQSHQWRHDRWTDPANQGTFEQARDYAEAHKMHGLGIVLTPGCGIAGGDLDHCVDPVSGAFSDTAKAIIAEAATYSELSPGLTGIRFLAKGSFGGFAGTDHAAGIEFYEAGHFLTITGNHIEETPFAIADRDLTELGRRFFPTKAPPPMSSREQGPSIRWKSPPWRFPTSPGTSSRPATWIVIKVIAVPPSSAWPRIY